MKFTSHLKKINNDSWTRTEADGEQNEKSNNDYDYMRIRDQVRKNK